MTDFMRKKIVIASSVCMAVGIISGISAYILARKENSEGIVIRESETAQIYKPVVTEEPEEEYVYEPIYYSVQTNGNALNLYEVRGGEKKVVKTFDINLQMFPGEDIELLRAGIKAYTLEDGLEIIENFIS